MNPCDALTKDYGMYYNGCWMKHSVHGIGCISVVSDRMYWIGDPGGSGENLRVQAKSLSCWWPRPGAFNVKGSAVYIARRAVRNMRKSAVGQDHYFVKWGNPYAMNVMLTLRDGPNHVTLRVAEAALSDGRTATTSVAITRDIIITHEEEKPNGRYTVIFRGLEAGTLHKGVFDPVFSGNPLTARVLRQLERVNEG
jgi:hypothetical protein